MQIAYNMHAGANIFKKLKLGATVANAGIPLIVDSTNDYGEAIPCTTTSMADALGLGLDTGTYTTTQSATMVEGVVTCVINPDVVIKALMSGGATESTALTSLVPTAANAAGTTITDADVGTVTTKGGTAWGASGANVGNSRIITTFNSGASIVVTVPFPNTIAITDVYHQCPFSRGGSAGMSNLQTTTLFTQANAAIVAGTGGVVAIVELELDASTNSYVYFVLADHVFSNVDTLT